MSIAEKLLKRSEPSNNDTFKYFNLKWLDKKLEVKDLEYVIGINEANKRPFFDRIHQNIKSGRIQFRYESKARGHYTLGTLASTKIGYCAQINVSSYVKEERGLSDTGRIEEIATLKDSDIFYSYAKIGFTYLHASKIFNSTIAHEVCELWVDMMSELISRKFGNFGDGDLGRFILAYWFYNGGLTPEEVAQKIKFSQGEVSALKFKFNSKEERFFDGIPLGLEDLCRVLNDEFQHIKPLSVVDLVKACELVYSPASIFMLDNPTYFLGIITNATDKFNLIPSTAMKTYKEEMVQIYQNITRNIFI